MDRSPPDRKLRTLDAAGLEQLALAYVGRYATTRAKLRSYLARKLRERDWVGGEPPAIDALVDRFAGLGYVDDAAYASSRASALARRGYGVRRVGEALRAAGISDEDASPARNEAASLAWETAVTFARRRRIGAFASTPADPDRRQRSLAAMLRAGHPIDLARRLVDAKPGEEPTADSP